MKRIICVFVLLASCLGASAETNLERVLNCEVSYTILNGYKVEQKVRITLPEGKRDLAVWLVERKKGGFKKLAYPIGGEGELRISRPFSKEESITYPFILTWQSFGRFRLTGFFLSRRYSHTVVVREVKDKRVIEIFPAFPGHIATKLATRGVREVGSR